MSQDWSLMYHKNVENICVVLLLTYLLTRMLQDFMSYKSQECHKIGVLSCVTISIYSEYQIPIHTHKNVTRFYEFDKNHKNEYKIIYHKNVTRLESNLVSLPICQRVGWSTLTHLKTENWSPPAPKQISPPSWTHGHFSLFLKMLLFVKHTYNTLQL